MKERTKQRLIFKKAILFDFDGVIHSYASGWKGIANIPDKPVDGILELLTNMVYSDKYEVVIYSSPSKSWRGRMAMKQWLDKWLSNELLKIENADTRKWKDMWQWKIINDYQSMDIWDEHISMAIKKFLNRIKFAKNKPAAYLTIDDRCICFDGKPEYLLDKIESFKVWNK